MKIIHRKKHLPRDFSGLPGGEGLVYQAEIKVTPRARLAAKLLVFKSNAALRKFWRSGLKQPPLCGQTMGVVQALARTWEKRDAEGNLIDTCTECDPRYFCIIALIQTELWLEYVSHEAGHAAFAYAKRAKKDFWPHSLDNHEEQFCYPLGRITKGIHDELCKSGLYAKTFTAARGYDKNQIKKKP